MFFVTTAAWAQHELTLNIGNISSTDGDILVAIYDDPSNFLDFEAVFKTGATKAVKGSTSMVMENIPAGTYAIAIFHDVNENTELDTNWLGIPKEDVAFSKGSMKTFGPPNFEECAFTLDGNLELDIVFD